MSFWRKVVLFPITRLVLWAVIMALLSFLFGRVAAAFRAGHLGFYAGMTLAGVCAYIFLALVVERRSLNQVGLGARGLLKDTFYGFLIGAAMLTAVIGVMAVMGWYRAEGLAVQGTGALTFLAGALFHYLLVAVNEEVALRGVFFRIFEEWLGSWIAVGLSALLFGLLHLGNPNATLAATLAITLEAGILLAAAYMLTRNLYMAIGIHWSWNFFQGSIYGAAVSGGQGAGLIRSTIAGPELFTGGAFGPEGGLIALAVGTAAGIALFLYAARRGHVVPPFWRRRAKAEGEVA